MFEGCADEALSLYTSLFEGSSVESMQRYPAEAGAVGKVMHAVFTLCGQQVHCTDSPIKHAFTFTPSFSLWVDLDDESNFERIFEKLSKDGSVLMPPNNYGFSKRFAWINDRFGVSWQLNVQ
jgi:predicted 3-demethylubiquinone-9 3-methyltransferase (glyoxalase superfamily)